MKNLVMHIEDLTKVYKLYATPMDRFKESLNPWKKTYHNEFFALKALNLDIYEGEVVGILGANGAGKSTLLKILAGVLTPNSGHVEINGKVSALLELGMGFNPELNGEDNIIFNATVLGLSPSSIQAKLKEIITFADIGEHIKQPLKTYSSGMVARLAFAIAVNLDAEILIIDEALSVGDVRFQQKAIRKMNQLMNKAKAIVFVSHSLDSIRRFCTRAVWLNAGQVVEDGNTIDVLKHYYTFMTGGDIVPQVSKPSVTKEISKEKVHLSVDNLEWQSTVKLESIGDNSAIIERIALYDSAKNGNVSLLEGGEALYLFLDIAVLKSINNPSIGFSITNHLGLNVFGISSTHFNVPLAPFQANTHVVVKVAFPFPYLLNGTYSLTVNISDIPDPLSKVKNHQVYDAYIIVVQSTDIKQKHGSIIIPHQATFEIL